MTPLILLFVLIGAILVVGVIIVVQVLQPQGEAPSTQPPPIESSQPTPEPTPEPTPTEDLTMGGVYTLDGVEEEDLGDEKTYKTTQHSLHIQKKEFDGADVWVAEIWVRDAALLQNCFAQDMLQGGVVEYAKEMAQRSNAIFAMNADYAAYRSTGVIVRGGEVLRDEPAQEVLALYADGSMRVFDTQTKAEAMESPLHTWSFGPSLLNADGTAKDGFSSYDTIADIVESKNPRAGVGLIEPLHYIFAVVDAPQRTSGMTLAQFAKVFADAGCTVAYNMDGGSSATMLYKGEIINEVNGDTGHAGPRRVSEIIYIAQ